MPPELLLSVLEFDAVDSPWEPGKLPGMPAEGCPPAGVPGEDVELGMELLVDPDCVGVDAVVGIPVEEAEPLCPEAVDVDDGLLELLLLLEEDEELEDELDELEDEELLLDDCSGELWLTEVWQALRNKLSSSRLTAAAFSGTGNLLCIIFIGSSLCISVCPALARHFMGIRESA